MKVNCLGCKKELDATENLKKCVCGWFYGLTPFFPYSEKQLKQRLDSRNKKK